MVIELANSPYPYDKQSDFFRFDYLLDRWNDTVENWNVLERIIDQFAEDHNLSHIPVSWVFDDYNLEEAQIEGRIEACKDLLNPKSALPGYQTQLQIERREIDREMGKLEAEKELKAVVEFMNWLLTVPEDIREFYHKVYEHDHDEWYLDSAKTGRLNPVTKA